VVWLDLRGQEDLGSPTGSIAETQDMLNFCGRHPITAAVEVIPI
jgi:uncharacterized zinc-type alcohol dehydrogenase-like protein